MCQPDRHEMVLSATDAFTLTTNTISRDTDTDIQTEISLVEAKIRSASGLGLYSISYNAKIIGNPEVDPRIYTTLPPTQITFYNLLISAGYSVTIDPASGYWNISWSTIGNDAFVKVYSFRTTYNPTSFADQVITVIKNFFLSLHPVVHSTVKYNGFIDETGFGGVSSTFYEFTIVVDQQDNFDNSTNLKLDIVSQGLGFDNGNCAVYRIVS
jgi:hypothetical protein